MVEGEKYTWIPFYEEFAKKLLDDKDKVDEHQKHTELVNKIKKINPDRITFLKAKAANNEFDDIDPFTVFAIFNRSSNEEKRKEILKTIQTEFGLKSDIPNDFDSLPLVNAQKSCFYDEKQKEKTIPLLWNLFAAFIEKKDDEIGRLFDSAQSKKNIKWNLTMAFFWMNPHNYMTLDSQSRNYLKKKVKINVFNERNLDFVHYSKLLDDIKNTTDKSFYVLSNEAWQQDDKLEVNGLMVQDNSGSWPDKLIADMNGDDHPGVFWWHEKPVGQDATIKLLREKLDADGSFEFYLFRDKSAIYKAIVSDFLCSKEEFSKKISAWKNDSTCGLTDSFENFKDSNGERKAAILFRVDEVEKLDEPIPMGNFETSKDYKKFITVRKKFQRRLDHRFHLV